MTEHSNVPPFFWLHIKKCGGGTVRHVLAPHYKLVERVHRPVNFIQSDRNEWNDILNNFRVPLGEYQFRRCLFARRFLYNDDWDSMLSFAFCRNPVERAVSAFHYLAAPRGGERSFVQHLIEIGQVPPKKTAILFNVFLDLVEEARFSTSIYSPVNLHFTTHTAAVWDDVTDEEGRLLLSHLYRLEDLEPAIENVLDICGLKPMGPSSVPRLKARDTREAYCPDSSQKKRIEMLWPHDFDLYESAMSFG